METMKLSLKEQKQLKTHMDYMLNDLRKWGIKKCQVINLQSKAPLDSEEPDKHIGVFMIQGRQLSPTGKIFSFQIVRDFKIFKDNGQPQYKVILQYGKEDSISTYPQTNPDLKAILLNYLYESESIKFKLEVEPEKSKSKK
jgi:hypothetical protein